ncbi:hypothetical protein T01_508, partial [Trichinella spiralis]
MKIDGVHRKQNPLGCATPEQSTKALRKRGKNLDRRRSSHCINVKFFKICHSCRQWFANFSGLRPTLDYYKFLRPTVRCITRCMRTISLFSVLSDDFFDVHTNIRKLLDNCSLFRNLVLIPIIAINPILHMYEVVKESSTFNAAVERVGY